MCLLETSLVCQVLLEKCKKKSRILEDLGFGLTGSSINLLCVSLPLSASHFAYLGLWTLASRDSLALSWSPKLYFHFQQNAKKVLN